MLTIKGKIYYMIRGVLMVLLLLIILAFINSYFGWYGYKKWENRAHSLSISESIKRGVFVKKLNYQINSFMDTANIKFEPFIEKGFKYGYHTSKETVLLSNTDYPYQLSFNYRPNQATTILIIENQLKKFDSANGSWGFLKTPYLQDTIFLSIGGENAMIGIIKVW